ncbi:DUF1206 domain-containing protein [Aestuariibacter sp. AA17]|uniref:DUF1206 domain-containing protein n=1 Tax=Fluctibacter corallii TaxID=2984329 RepID=A0ABT3A895_9ALTE|nr:DUF1206 domain-containing protein [Aestuariibacter sp. AA17]MCV2884551.1 DUF1206 domain-containing protein [Aestuariibacter sp. AA17]
MEINKTIIKRTAQVGYAAKTVSYTTLGFLIVASALNMVRASPPSKDDVFLKLASLPFGNGLLLAVIFGFIAYAIWRWLQCALDLDNQDADGIKHFITRAFYLFSGTTYFILAYGAFSAYSHSSSSHQGSKGAMKSYLAQQPLSDEIYMLIGALILCFAAIQFKHVYQCDFLAKLNTDNMSDNAIRASKIAGRFGFAGRGIVYTLVGVFFILAGIHSSPEHAGGLTMALNTLLAQAFGQYLLAATGFCLLLFGVFCGFEARFRKVE